MYMHIIYKDIYVKIIVENSIKNYKNIYFFLEIPEANFCMYEGCLSNTIKKQSTTLSPKRNNARFGTKSIMNTK